MEDMDLTQFNLFKIQKPTLCIYVAHKILKGGVIFTYHSYLSDSETPQKPFAYRDVFTTNLGYVKKSYEKINETIGVKPIVIFNHFSYHPFDCLITNEQQLTTILMKEYLLIFKLINNLHITEIKEMEIYLHSSSKMTLKLWDVYVKTFKEKNKKIKILSSDDDFSESFNAQFDKVSRHTFKNKFNKKIDDHYGFENTTVLISVCENRLQKQNDFMEFNGAYSRKEYFEKAEERHPLLGFNKLYFSSKPQDELRNTYFLAETKLEPQKVGQALSDTSYAVIKSTDSIYPLDLIFKVQERYSNDHFSTMMMINLNDLYHPDSINWIERHGEDVFYKDEHSLSLRLGNGKYITHQINPVGLSLRAIEHMGYLDTILHHFKQGTTLENSAFYDITSEFFTEVKNKKNEILMEVNKAFKPGINSHEIKIAHDHVEFTLKLLFTYDLPNINLLKRLSPLNPNIYLFIWKESTTVYNYATVFRCDLGYGIWSNYFSNRIFLL